VAKQSVRAHEVLVLDDASDQLRVADVLREVGIRDVRVLRAQTPLGIAAGRNRLVNEASGEAFFVLDDDAYFDGPDCLARVSDVLRERPKTAIVATRIVDHKFSVPRLLIPFPRHEQRRSPPLVDRAQLVSYFLGGAHAIRRELFERIGGYHDSFVFGEEELDLSYRAIQAGYEIFYSPDILVHHDPMPSVLRSTSRPQTEIFYHVRNRLFLAKQFLPAAYIVPYLAIWLSRYAVSALRNGTFRDFLGGIKSGFLALGQHTRTPLRGAALSYLRANHGRLLF
jgi:GT2 family glycosyltransferase